MDRITQLPGKPTVQDFTLTTAMRTAIEQRLAKKLRQRWLVAAFLAVLAIVGLVLFVVVGRTSRDSGFVVLGFVLVVGAIIAGSAWLAMIVAPRKLAKVLQDGIYPRYIGWFVVMKPRKGSHSMEQTHDHFLILAHTSLRVPHGDGSAFFKKSPPADDPWFEKADYALAPNDDPWWVAIDYVQGTDMVLAIWHERWGLVHRHPLYDAENDPELERPVLETPAKPALGRSRR